MSTKTFTEHLMETRRYFEDFVSKATVPPAYVPVSGPMDAHDPSGDVTMYCDAPVPDAVDLPVGN